MAHYALIDKTNFVVNVIVGRDENDIIDGISDWEDFYSKETGLTCKRTSYNNNIRKHYAGIGFYYDEKRDAFIPPAPGASWTLNENSYTWEPPIERPDGAFVSWNEELQSWEPFKNV